MTFAGYVRGQKTMVGVTADCRQCDVVLHVDCAPAPAWVAMGDTEAFWRYFSVWLQREHPSPGEP